MNNTINHKNGMIMCGWPGRFKTASLAITGRSLHADGMSMFY
jgi:hypothetical protein